MTPEEIEAAVRPHFEAEGLEVLSVLIKPYDQPPLDCVPVVNLFVRLDSLGAEEVCNRMNKAERAMCHEFGAGVRTGYYSAEIGYEDVPVDQALIEVDCLPFDLDMPAAPPSP